MGFTWQIKQKTWLGKKWCFGNKVAVFCLSYIYFSILAFVIFHVSSFCLWISQAPAQQVMMPPSSQSSSPQQQQQPEGSSALQSSSLTQTGSQLPQVTCSIMSNLHDQTSVFLALFFLYFLLKNITNTSPCYLFFHILHAAYSCMIISLGPVIQVLLSCLLHSTQSIFSSSIRPHASLFCRYSIEDKTNVCRWVCPSHESFALHLIYFFIVLFKFFIKRKS